MSSTSDFIASIRPTQLPPPRRIITTRSPCGKSIISKQIQPYPPRFEVPGLHFYLGYTLGEIPALLDDDQDLSTYKGQLPHKVGTGIPGGTVLRVIDFLPGFDPVPLHRTKTVDFGVILEGELELILDSEESTILKRGDIIVQRGTIHSWKNTSLTQIARALFVLVDATLPTNKSELSEGDHRRYTE